MAVYKLKIVTPVGIHFEGDVTSCTFRSISGDITILPKHIDYVTGLGLGVAHIVDENGQKTYAYCQGGMLSCVDNTVNVLAVDFQWAKDIDIDSTNTELDAEKANFAQLTAREDLEVSRMRVKRLSAMQNAVNLQKSLK